MLASKVCNNEIEGSISSRYFVYKLLELELGSPARDVEAVKIATPQSIKPKPARDGNPQ